MGQPVVAAVIAVLVGALWSMLAPVAVAAPPSSTTPATKAQVEARAATSTGAKATATAARAPRTSTTTSTKATTTSAGTATGSRAPTATTPAAKVCVDEVGVLGSALCAKVTAILDADEQLTTDEVAVLVVDTTGDETIEHYATRTFNSWGIGKADKNNGVLLLVAVDDRALRIEVGTGLEQTLTDGEAEEIIYGTITPEFKAGDYRAGILAGLDAIRTHLRHRVASANALAGLSGDPGSDDPPRTSTSRYQYAYDSAGEDGINSSNGSAVLWIVLLVILMLGSWAWSAYRRGNGDDDDSPGGYRRPYRSRGSRSFGSGSSHRSSGSSSRSSGRSGFGGGRSRGGGGSGSW